MIHTSVRCAFSTREDSEAGASGSVRSRAGSRRGRSVFDGVGGAVSGIAALPGRLLRRGGRCTTAAGSAAGVDTAHPAPLTELVLAEKRAADAAGSPGANVATPARPAAWEARLRVSVASRWKQNLRVILLQAKGNTASCLGPWLVYTSRRHWPGSHQTMCEDHVTSAGGVVVTMQAAQEG